MFDFNKIIYEWQAFYYTPLLMFITEITTLIIILKTNQKIKIETLFFFLFLLT